MGQNLGHFTKIGNIEKPRRIELKEIPSYNKLISSVSRY